MGLFPTLQQSHRKNPVALPAFFADFQDIFDNFAVCKGEAFQFLPSFLIDGGLEVFKEYSAYVMRTDTHVYHIILPVVTRAHSTLRDRKHASRTT